MALLKKHFVAVGIDIQADLPDKFQIYYIRGKQENMFNDFPVV